MKKQLGLPVEDEQLDLPVEEDPRQVQHGDIEEDGEKEEKG
jgi:hypothetical protein